MRVEPSRQRHVHPRRAPDQAYRLIEEQDQAEGAEHMVEMIAAIKPAHSDHLHRHANQKRAERPSTAPSTKLPVQAATVAAK